MSKPDFANLAPSDTRSFNARFEYDQMSPEERRKFSAIPGMHIPMALQIDEELKNLPEPQRTDYQILIDERADELVH
jgi:hypothetical protein